MFKKTKVCSAAVAALGSLLLAHPGLSFAQAAERVEITGSRIKSLDAETASPIVTLSAEAIKVEGIRNVEQLLNNLPQVFADQGAQVSNGATGTATVNLRNLGSNRTLVLVNGRRLPAGSPRDVSADLNQIPIALIKRVEVLTGGASAVYGSDAIAGVVNFIMRDDFEGIQVDLNTQFYNHKQGNAIGDVVRARGFPTPGNITNDGEVHDFNILMGGNFANGKGNATVFLSYKKEEALLQSERDFTACALNFSAASGFSCGGSGTSFPGQFTDFATYALTVADAQGNVRPYSAARDAYNFGPLNYLQRPSERYGFHAQARYEINPLARVYSELSFHDDSTVAQIAPSGLFFFGATGPNAIRFENPLLSSAWRTALGLNAPGDTAELYIGRRNVEGGGRQDDIRHSSYRAVLGVQGDIGAWNYDVSAQTGRVLFQETYFNDFSNTRIARALDVVAGPDGTPTCRSVVDGSDPNCVPYDIWSLGKVTPAALEYLQTPGFQRGTTQQSVLTATVAGDLGQYGIKLPTAKSGVGVVFGIERRFERLTLNTDNAFTTGDLAGQGGPTIGVGGSYGVNDVFGEVRLPLIEKMPFVELLNLTGTYRASDYSTGKKTDTYGLGLEYVPIKQIKLRGSYQSAARAANVIELFSSQALGLYDNNSDPCAGATPSATLAECARTGVTSAQYGRIADSPAGQYNQITGGNRDLRPEKSTSYTLGLAASPIDNLTVTLDYFNIKLEDRVGTAPPTTTLQQCLTTGNPAFCGLIQRDAIGTLWATNNAFILATNANLGKSATQGIDIGADYSMKLGGLGGLAFSFLGTALQKFESEDLPGLGTYDCAGLFGNTCGTPLPKWRHKLRTTWSSPFGFDLAFTWRHLDKVTLDSLSSDPDLAGPQGNNVASLASRNYFDLAAAYTINKNFTVRASISNLFDKDPPIRTQGAGFANGNTYPVVYDSLGRRIGLSLTATF
jgi:outer membrane receptor protein involved in Fe transport